MKYALVTGSSKGIGKGIAAALAESGYRVFVNGRNSDNVARAVSQIGPNAISLVGDLSDSQQIAIAIESIEKHCAGLDLLVANIGSGRSTSGWNVSLTEMRRIFEINFFSAVGICHMSLPLLRERKGHAIFISSIAGCEALGAPIAYSAAKSALLSYAKNLSIEAAPLGIRVNSISPGNVMFAGSTWEKKLNDDPVSTQDYIRRNVPLNRFATPEDISRAVLYLEENHFVNGSNLVVDGGQVRSLF
jgi:3-oxoacyl-[acyl-carrier protein] reductase